MSMANEPETRWHHQFRGIRAFNRHSLILTVAGVGYILTGVTYIFSTLVPSRREALAVALDWFPIQGWGIVFIFVGLLAVISSRWPMLSTAWGYAILTGLSAGWSATYISGVMFEHAPVGNLTASLQWGLLAFLWWAIPGLVSPDKTVVVVVNKDGNSGTS